MVRVTEELALSPDHVTLYQATDPLVGHLPVLIFYGHSTTANYTFNSSRVQVHIYTPTGFQSFPRLTISPNSPFYNVVNYLPREFQGDEVYRALAFGVFKYFSELPDAAKTVIKQQYPTTRGRRPGSLPTLFSEQHAADIAKSMVRSENTADVIQKIHAALQTQHINNVDIDLVLPPGSIVPLEATDFEDLPEDEEDIMDPTLRQYGNYTPLIKLFGEPIFLPTSKLRRAPSKPSALNRTRSFSKEQKLELRHKMAELVDTEERYVLKLKELVKSIAPEYRQKAKDKKPDSFSPSEEEVEKLFPRSSEKIFEVNSAFMEELLNVMGDTEGSASKDMDAGQQSSFSQRVATTGEQHLRSIVIEPVQRLPRYSLVIDQIVGCLPITHPALQPMLKARDIIANICSMDDPLSEKPHVSSRLRNMIESWPVDFHPQGIFLLFSDCIIIVKKVYGAGITSRELLRELDKPSPAGLLASMTNAAGGPGSYELAFAGWHDLADIRFTESSDGHAIWMTSAKEMKGAHAGPFVTSTAVTSRYFILQELYEGKAAKWSEDVVKARVEGRYSEAEREDPCWTLRSVRMPDTGLGLYAAVFQEGLDQLIDGRKEPAPIRIVVDHEKGTKGAPVGHYGVEICSDIKTLVDMKRVVVVTIGLHGKKTTDEIALDDFLPTLARRIIQLLNTQYNVSNPLITTALVSFHTKVLRSFSVSNRTEKTRSFLATSPVKYLSSFLSGGSVSDLSALTKHNRTPSDDPTAPPPNLSRNNSMRESMRENSMRENSMRENSVRETNSLYSNSTRSRDGIRMGVEDERPENPLVRLEQTFTGYVASLQARKGNIIGRAILNRGNVDELSVNDLYNKLIENPFEIESSYDVTADVVFTAFEKFVRIAWREQMGPIMTIKALDALQERAAKRLPGDFADFVTFLFADMAPQNRRAFTALIKLLADLLDGCGNDSDRGALTASFTELLVDDGSAHSYINLLDKLVEDCDRIFDDGQSSFSTSVGQASSAFESMNSTIRSGKSHTGSLTSNTSSLRRKLGFDNLLRQNSKTNDADPRSSVWKTLSKQGRHPVFGEPSMGRSKSIDAGISKFRRPGSRDRPPIAGAFEDSGSRPTSSQRLETIGEPETEEVAVPKSPRRKRRSSLSDLKNLVEAITLDDDDDDPPQLQPAPEFQPAAQLQPAVQLQPLSRMRETSQKFNSGPRVPSPSKIPISPNSGSVRSPRIKDTTEDPFKAVVLTDANTNPRRGHSKTLSSSHIPTLKSSRSVGAEGLESPFRPTTSPHKSPSRLRLQSPQKLRERLQVEKKAVEDVDATLQSELSKIAADMAKVNSNLPRSPTVDIRKLSLSVAALEERLPSLVSHLTDRQELLRRDMDATLKATEAKVRAIDQLYKESTAENELLYEKFNGELGKIVKALKGKGREDKEDLMARVRDSSEETARVKKENARLRREMVSLRALIRGAGGSASGSPAGSGNWTGIATPPATIAGTATATPAATPAGAGAEVAATGGET
ncbi:putative rho guanyl nucleotide exchange factor protein [Eutypa lata UCREL1]|uniref:Putative rho guanyl nucleotide exchange factor protein n=1 Tax=Eutypa lata (strain UCR-EL1) TaxID=1287681 RepID=M7SBU6_EUTLA|nr:putative rho guanyl nucleotide exchange factor protein [Eutypa lata UCREL1]